MICLGYLSSATRPIEDSELSQILTTSQRNNAAAEVTGLLCFYEGSFLQFLEGEEARVLSTYARIGGDARHTGLIKICHRPIETRAFGEWSMGVVKPGALGDAEQAFVSELRSIKVSPDAAHRDAIAPFLDTFRQWMR